jgi:hypothetical protein
MIALLTNSVFMNGVSDGQSYTLMCVLPCKQLLWRRAVSIDRKESQQTITRKATNHVAGFSSNKTVNIDVNEKG